MGKGVNPQVTFLCCPGVGSHIPLTDLSMRMATLFKAPRLLISANTLDKLHGNLPTKSILGMYLWGNASRKDV